MLKPNLYLNLNMSRESWVNLSLLILMVLAPVIATVMDEVYYVNLSTRIIIIAMAAVGLNVALGFGGMVSFGHAAFFGLGGYVAGIAALHSFEGTLFLGANSRYRSNVIDLACGINNSGDFCSVNRGDQPAYSGCLFYYDHACLCADGLLPGHIIDNLRR